MKSIKFIILTALISPCIFSQVPESFIGVWNGNGVQTSPSSTWTISVVIRNDGSEIAYPSLNCGGNLELVSSEANKLVFSEQINFGVNSCITSGTVTLTKSESNPNELVYRYETGLSSAIAEGTIYKTKSNLEWPNLQTLVNDYNSKIGTNKAPYSHQILCMAQRSCLEHEQNPDGWASDFVLFMFKNLINSMGSIPSLSIECHERNPNAFCFNKAGLVHQIELRHAFAMYCISKMGNINIQKWNEDHENFFDKALSPCFKDLETSNELSRVSRLFYENIAILFARGLRTLKQDFISTIPVAKIKLNKGSSRNTLPAPPTKEDLYITELDNSGTLTVSSNAPYFLSVDEEINIAVTHNESGIDLTTSPNTEYYSNLSNEYLSISDDGLVKVLKSPAPIVNERTPFFIYVENDDSYGYIQFAIYDNDSDNDFIVDSYEKSIGMDANSSNFSLDSDSDGLSDFIEVILNTNFLDSDSDNDFYDDSFEAKAGSNPLDFNSTPLTENKTLSIFNKVKNNVNLKIYPNPSSGNIKIDIRGDVGAVNNIAIYNHKGQLIKSNLNFKKDDNSNIHILNIDNLDPSLYFLIIKLNGGGIITKKIIVF